MSKPIDIYPMRQSGEDYVIKMDPFHLPMRLCIIGASQRSGKTLLVSNLLLRKELYKGKFEGENIFIISPSVNTDVKIKTIIKQLDVPRGNVFLDYNEDRLEALYQMMEDEYNEAIEDEVTPPRFLVFFDDMSFSGALKAKAHGAINKLYMNGRHINCSSIVTSQKYSDISTGIRENATGIICFSCSDKQLEQIVEDHNIIGDKKEMQKTFRKITNKKHAFFVVNYNRQLGKGRYMNERFVPIDQNMTHIE